MLTISKQTMIDSYRNISFSPEKRGEQDHEYYTKLLASDLETLGDNQGNYAEKFNDKLARYYACKGRTASAMICGPAKFPFGKNHKAINSEMKAWEDFTSWREGYFKAVNRVRTKSPEQEIDDALEELERLTTKHELYKEMNAIKNIEDKRTFAEENDFMKVFEYWSNYGHCVPAFQLTSNRNKIKRLQEKLETMRKRVEVKTSFEGIKFEGGKIVIENDRVIIKHDQKPEQSVINALKSKGFNWSPRGMAWMRKHTQAALWDAQNIVGVKS